MSRCHRKKKSKSHKSRSQSLISDFDSQIGECSAAEPKFEIKVSKIMGRYMVATNDIKPGEVILSEEPLVVGPCTGCKLQCLGCYTVLEKPMKLTKCYNCSWPLCSRNCPGLHKKHGHTELECSILKECKSASFFDDDPENITLHMQAIVPLRCLLLKTTDPSVFNNITDMESHNEIRKNIPEVWNGNQRNVVDRIVKDWGLTEFTSDEVHTICGILEVNCFEIGQQGINIRGMYPTAFLMSHDCVPNTNHIDEETDYRLTVRASTALCIGQPITLSYAYTLQSTLRRREHLLDNKFFECCCQRCSDPAELGAYSGALICPKCTTGLVLSNDPLNAEADWSCGSAKIPGKCPGYTITARSMHLLINRVTQEIDSLDCNDIKGLESFLDKYRNVLHPTHYLCLGVKLSLSQLYGKISGYLIHEITEPMLMRKINICKEIMRVFDVIEPGYTRIRGVTLYELHAPLMILLTRAFEKHSMSKSELKLRLKEVVRCLVEACAILSNEPATSSEGMMGKAAKEALLQIKDWEKIVGRI